MSTTLCDTAASFESAVSVLQSCSSLIVDCEGLDLGNEGGDISLISVLAAAPHEPRVFLFDLVQLSTDLKPLFDLLTSSNTLKILYDGRMDFCALHHSYGIDLANVIDLQIADVRSRPIRGEKQGEQRRRLGRCFSQNQLTSPKHAYKYDSVHQLQGLGSCLVDHKLKATSPKGHVNHDSWMERPLSPEHLHYAANDLHLIQLLLSHFREAGYIDADLWSQSQRYISIWTDAPPLPTDIYRSHPLLPLEIIHYNPSAPTRICQGCARNLSRNSFPNNLWANNLPPGRKRHCWVCLAIPHWIQTVQFREAQKEKRKAMKNDESLRQGEATAALFGLVSPAA